VSRCFQICLATLFVGISLPASDRFVTGRVVDENSAAVAEARVTLSAGSVTFQTSSDPTGSFQLRLLPGEYSVTVEREGFFTLRQNAVRLGNQPQELHLVLNHLREVFQAVKVEGKPTAIDVEQTERKETLSGLNILGVPYPSPHALRNAMKLMPGVIQDASGALHFSGSTENQVLYTLDGFNVGDPLTGTFTTRLNTDMVRSIEYSTGRHSPEFGKGSAGVVAIRTEMGDDALRYRGMDRIRPKLGHCEIKLGSSVPCEPTEPASREQHIRAPARALC